jgi:hypothetical protein
MSQRSDGHLVRGMGLLQATAANMTAQQIIESFPDEMAPLFLLMDHDQIYRRRECLDHAVVFGESRLRRIALADSIGKQWDATRRVALHITNPE